MRILILVLMGINCMCAQNHELGKVTVAELQQTECTFDKSADAAVLFQTGEADIHYLGNGFESKLTVCVKIKIYNSKAYDLANRRIMYLTDSGGERVSFSAAATYNLVDGKIVKTALQKDGIFTQKVTKNVGMKTITMPDVREGSIIEYQYERSRMGVLVPPKWDFQETIPVNYSQYKVRIPQYLIFNTRQKGWIFPQIAVNKQGRNNYEETITTYSCSHIPAIKEERYVTNIKNYTSGIMHELAAYNLPGRYVNSYDNLAGDWKTISKKLYENENFGKQLIRKGFFELAVDSVTKGLTSREQIINAVFKLAQKKVVWNKNEGFICENGIKTAFKDGAGNAADVNLLLTAMLRYLQLNAHPVLISTQQNGMVFFPSLSSFDFVIVGVETSAGTILLDATHQFSSPNILPIRDLNWVGRLLRSDETSVEIDLFPAQMSKMTSVVNCTLNETGTIEGKIRRQYTGHEALTVREKLAEVSQESYLENLERLYKGLEIAKLDWQNEKDADAPLSELFDFKMMNEVETVGDKLYLRPMLCYAEKENPFKQEKREYPIDCGYPVQKKTIVSIAIPKGYAVASIPESVSISSEDKICVFNYAVAVKDNVLQLSATLDITRTLIPPDLYAMLQLFYQQVVDKQQEAVIFKKV